jgi:geranyl-CoA carboxylase alpha subunit
MIRKILIANRGEIAIRIMHTCQHMGITTVAVYSDADENALHVKTADEAVHIGGSPARESYLNIDAIIAAAQRTGADAVHPGYGFLSENHLFARAVIDAGMIWIGPAPDTIEAMGDKRRAKLMLKDIPLIPGYNGDDQSDDALIAAADDIGFPIMVKAAAGGGGKGMRAVHSRAELPDALATARREAQQAFGDATLILEKLLVNPRHIEIQIFGDTHGNVISLGERECSIQRRHQKIIEEAPSVALDDDLRQRMSDVAVNIGRQLHYVNAGTIEFLLDQDKNFYFMEMNTRLQVEHRVTELIWGHLDLVSLQIRAAMGERTVPDSVRYSPHGHAIELRIYAEDAANDFLPSIGRVLRWNAHTSSPDQGIDHAVQHDDPVSTFYDPMLAKLFVYGDTRDMAVRRLNEVLVKTYLLGVKSNIDFLRRVINHPDFVSGNIDTGFIDRHPELLADPAEPPPIALIAVSIAKSGSGDHWRNNAFRPVRHTFSYNERNFTVELTKDVRISQAYHVNMDGTHIAVRVWSGDEAGEYAIALDGHRQNVTIAEGDDHAWWVHCPAGTFKLTWIDPLPAGTIREAGVGSLRSPMPGTIRMLFVENGQSVAKGDILLVIEAMKMEHRIKSPHDGIVRSMRLSVGQYVQEGVTLLEIAPTDSDPQ